MRKKLKLNQQTKKIFSDGFEEFILSKRAMNLRPHSINHYMESYKTMEKYIDVNIPIENIDKSFIDNYVIALTKRDLKTQTIHSYVRDLKTILYYFMKLDYMKTFKITLPKVDKVPIETYSDAELRILLKKPNIKTCSFVEIRDWTLINFILSTGVRLNSFINIRVKDIDFENNVVYVNTTKNRKPLIIPLNEIIVKILKDYLRIRQYQNTEDYLFCTVYGDQMNKRSVNSSLNNYNSNRGITKTGIHRYRHTFAKKWILAGGSVTVLQKILGHSSLNITENYINLLVEDLKKDINQFNILQEFNKTHIKL
ncbi:integrase/recombinase XerD [Clostridium cavendishii DSM 21758]|uniref:Integrase/recombinase XerD n=1 Tax=Clostridium cavendishii DSM 21758 TaxID=1121302 RepID=A0A1M6RRB1_9CLOT|nr:site-specific integrase [Clostridium cavendishii]SHK34944.1 integrase/recombinase XerD [Clostridium cavendishii DSM 21758]